ncbi:MAG: MFS transporter [Hellea sp.]
MTDFRGWHVLGASFVTAMLMAGATFYSFQHFVTPIEAEFGLQRNQVNLGMMAFLLSSAIWAAIVGKSIRRINPRTLALAGIVSFTLGFIALSFAQSPRQMMILITLPIGFGFTACGPFIANVLTTNWFYKKRGRALGIAAVATSAGGFLVQPVFSYMIFEYGWRSALLYMGLAIGLISAVLALRYFISKPEDIGQFPDGDTRSVEQKITASDPSLILKNRDFWVIALACGLLLASDQALLVSLKPFGENLGFTNTQATLIPTVVAGSAILGKLLIGWMIERFDKRFVFALVCLSNVIFLLAAVYVTSFVTLVTVAAFVGMAIGGIYPVWTGITADTFGRDYFAPAIGMMNIFTVILAVVAIGFVGSSYTQHQSYDQAFKILIPVTILSAIVMAFVRVKKDNNA